MGYPSRRGSERVAPWLQHAVKLGVEIRRIQLTRQCEGWRVVNHPREGRCLQARHLLTGVAEHARDPRVLKQRPRPRVAPDDRLCRRVEFDSHHSVGDLSRSDGGVTQTGADIQDAPAARRGCPELGQRIPPRIAALDAVHGQARDEHGRRAEGRVEAVVAVGGLRVGLDFFDLAAGDYEAGGGRFGNHRYRWPGQALAVWQDHPCAVQKDFTYGEVQVQRGVRAALSIAAGAQQWRSLVM